MRIRPGLQVLRCAPDAVQLGADPRWSVRFTQLSQEQVEALLSLPHHPGAAPAATLEALGGPVRQALIDSGALLAPAGRMHGGSADAVAWGHLRGDGDGQGTVGARADRTVGILGLGRLGLRLAQCLASAGVGRLVLDDDRRVTHADLSPGGYALRDLTRSRSVAAAANLGSGSWCARGVAASTVVPDGVVADASELDVVVLVARGAVDPATLWRLVGDGITHLPVVWGEAGVCVGPMVRPGASPCLRCVDLARRDADAAWPLLRAQLARQYPDEHEETLLAAVGAAVAAAQVLGIVDGRPLDPGTEVEVELPDAVPRTRRWPAHPECGCLTPAPLRP